MGTNCAPLVADFFSFCYERDFMTSFSNNNQAHIIEAFNSTSLYLDDLLDINNPNFEGIVNLFFPPELKFNKANTSDTKTIFLDLHLSISNGLRCQKSINDCDRHPPTSKYNFTSLYINKDWNRFRPPNTLKIAITDDLDWGHQFSKISSKATKTMSFY